MMKSLMNSEDGHFYVTFAPEEMKHMRDLIRYAKDSTKWNNDIYDFVPGAFIKAVTDLFEKPFIGE
jgi:hypothetical protein